MKTYLRKLKFMIRHINIKAAIKAAFKGMRIKEYGPLMIVFLAGVLLSCNMLLLYRTGCDFQKEISKHDEDMFNVNEQRDVLSNQRFSGSGWNGVPNPFPIPADTVLFGSDQIFNQDDQRDKASRERRRFMTIGIPSVWRKEYYLYQTIDSIIEQTSEKEKLDIYVFLLLADADQKLRYERAKKLESKYRQHIESGLLRILQPPLSSYPKIDFSKVRRTNEDPLKTVQWRTKQVFDFRFLFHYTWTRDPSPYFLLLEDDILSARHFVSAIKDFVNVHKSHHWVALQLASFMGIGQLIRCQDLDRLSSFLSLFYTEQPVDVLIDYWIPLMNPEKHPKNIPTKRSPSLFQHIGLHSTLANKTQRDEDFSFRIDNRLFNHINPAANLTTTMIQLETFGPELAYGSSPGLFWGKSKPNDTFDIVFSQPLHLSHLFISTGTYVRKSDAIVVKLMDKLLFGHVEVSSKFYKMESSNKAFCTKFKFLGEFKDGEVDFDSFPEQFPSEVQCIRIVIDPPQDTWVAISEIAVFTMDETNQETD